jgi:hypothetical protein
VPADCDRRQRAPYRHCQDKGKQGNEASHAADGNTGELRSNTLIGRGLLVPRPVWYNARRWSNPGSFPDPSTPYPAQMLTLTHSRFSIGCGRGDHNRLTSVGGSVRGPGCSRTSPDRIFRNRHVGAPIPGQEAVPHTVWIIGRRFRLAHVKFVKQGHRGPPRFRRQVQAGRVKSSPTASPHLTTTTTHSRRVRFDMVPACLVRTRTPRRRSYRASVKVDDAGLPRAARERGDNIIQRGNNTFGTPGEDAIRSRLHYQRRTLYDIATYSVIGLRRRPR